MPPMAPPSLTSSPSLRFSKAISTAASPLQSNFSLSCRSPLRPAHDAEQRKSFGPGPKNGRPAFLEPPSHFPSLGARTPDAKVVYEVLSDDGYDSVDSPTDQAWLLPPHSPGLPQLTLTRDEGKLGAISAINIIVGKTVGVGVYTVPSAIFEGVGSVGMTLLVWIIGSIISFCGLAVYLDLGTAIPKSGGERIYLERIFPRPYMLATCMFMSYAVLLGFSTPNAIVLGEYVLYSLDIPANRWNVRAIAVVSVSVLCYIHSRHSKLGLRLINVLGVAKMLIIVVVILSGIAGGLMRVGSNQSVLSARRQDIDWMDGDASLSTAQRNFSDIWAGSSSQPYDYATALLKVIYCFRGYSTANQVLSDVKNPVKTLKTAAPIALSLVSLAYLAVNIAFFLVVDKEDFKSAGVIVAGVFFRNVFGPGAGVHILPLFVIISAAGNIAATSFAQARVNEELAKDGLLPWSRFWESSAPTPPEPYRHPSSSPTKNRSGLLNKTNKTVSPSRGLLLHWLVSVLVIVLPPPGRIYNFLVDIGGYPVSVISVAVSAGLLYLHSSPAQRWTSPCRAPRSAVIVFAAGNCLLLLLPWVPPASGRGEDEQLAYYAYPATALAVLGSGAVYWCWWRVRGQGRSGRVSRWGVESSLGEECDEGIEGLLSPDESDVELMDDPGRKAMSNRCLSSDGINGDERVCSRPSCKCVKWTDKSSSE